MASQEKVMVAGGVRMVDIVCSLMHYPLEPSLVSV